MSSYFNWQNKQALFSIAKVTVDGKQYEWVTQAITGKKGRITYLKECDQVELEGHVIVIFGEDDDT